MTSFSRQRIFITLLAVMILSSLAAQTPTKAYSGFIVKSASVFHRQIIPESSLSLFSCRRGRSLHTLAVGNGRQTQKMNQRGWMNNDNHPLPFSALLGVPLKSREFVLRSSGTDNSPTSSSCGDNNNSSSSQLGGDNQNHLPSPQKVKVLGVCGGIGSGKSLACKILVSELKCAAHIDADSLAHSVYAPGSEALTEIANEFGPTVLDEEGGSIDRKKLGSIVFADPKAMSKLEHIVWPHVKALIDHRVKEIDDEFIPSIHTNAVVVVEAAMMLDAGWEFDGIWVVRAPKSTTQERLVTERGMDADDALLRIDAQTSRRGIGNLEEEVAEGVVTAIIENDGSIQHLTDVLAKSLTDPTAWKKGRAPNIVAGHHS